MTDFVTIKEGIRLFLEDNKRNPSFIGTVYAQSDLRSGTKDGRDWTNRTFTIEDSTDEIELTAWGDEIKLIKIGYKYEFTTPWWKDYEGKVQLGLGKWASIKCVGSAETPTIVNDVTSEQQQPETGDDPKEPTKVAPLPATSELLDHFIMDETIFLLQIEQGIKKYLKQFDPQPLVDQKVGMFVKILYAESKKTNLTKASKI